MQRAAQLRSALELSLEQRIPAAFSPRNRSVLPTMPTGIAAIDTLLEGGLPLGAITEVVGGLSSGRLTCAHAFVAEVMRAGQVCAWIDVSDSFDPESAASGGVDLDRLLWVRCGKRESERSPLFSAGVPNGATVSLQPGTPLRSGGSPHPRHEIHGLPDALGKLLTQSPLPRRRRQVGTPGAANRSLTSTDRVEQVAFDRLPSRRGSYLLEQRETPRRRLPAAAASGGKGSRSAATAVINSTEPRPWDRLDQALRATDLLLQAGGFGALVLDLGGIDAASATRVPLATWFRFRAAAERSQAAFVLLSQHPCAQSSAEVVLRSASALPEGGSVLTSIPFTVERVRQRFLPALSNVISMRKPPQRATTVPWMARTVWAGFL